MSPTMETVLNDVHYSLFKGEPGTRKSTQALSYPKPQYWFSFDGKMNALAIPMLKWGINPKDISYDDYTDWTHARDKLESMRGGTLPYKTIVIDSITSCADYMLNQVLRLKTGTRSSGQAAGKKIGNISVNEIEDFNAESAGLTELITLTKDIHKYHKIDIILIAHIIRTEQKSLDGKVNVSRTIVTAGKKPAAKIPAYCDETYQFSIATSTDADKPGECTILTSHAGEDFARTSLPLPHVIKIGDDPLYKTYVKPAIDKISTYQQSVTKGE